MQQGGEERGLEEEKEELLEEEGKMLIGKS